MLHVREREYVRRRRNFEISAVRSQCACHGIDRVLVLLEILIAVKQLVGTRGIATLIAELADGAGKDPTRDEIASAAHQQFRRCTDEAVNAEGPGRRVGGSEVDEQVTRIKVAFDVGDDVARENHLVDLACVDACDCVGD